MTRIQVLRFLRDCKSTHADWVKHYEKYPQEVRIHRLVAGSKASNKRLVKQYAATIRFIEENT